MKPLYLLLLLLTSPVLAQHPIIPQPAVIQSERGEFTLKPGLSLWTSPGCAAERDFLKTYWRDANLPELTTASKAKRADVILSVDPARQEALGTEGYELAISTRRLVVTGATPAGIFYGLQTLRQLLPSPTRPPQAGASLTIPALLVRDKPRFSWRSFTLEDKQSSSSPEAIKKLLDQLALLKFNRFHWHLPIHAASQNQAKNEQSYTPEQRKLISAYGEERHITVAIETGPASSSKADAYPYRLTPESVVYFWKGNAKGLLEAARRGQNLVNANQEETNLNHPITDLSIDRVYRFDPVPDQMPEDLRLLILGVNYQLTTANTTTLQTLLPAVHSRLAAASEVTWTFGQHKELTRFKEKLNQLKEHWLK